MSKKNETGPIRAKVIFKGKKIEYWDLESAEQLSQALADDFRTTGRVPVKIILKRMINGITLSDSALQRIACLQEDNSTGFAEQKETLSMLLVEVVQQNVGGDQWTAFAKVLADQIDFINSLQTR